MPHTDETELRLTFTLPGSASLGAFQAGAISVIGETIVHLRDRGRPVRVDAVGGASAGAIVALFFVHCLAEGLSVAETLRRAWVDEVDVDLLRAGDPAAPLGFSELRSDICDFFDVEGHASRQLDHDVVLHIGLTNLRGLTYPLDDTPDSVEAVTFADWARFDLSPGGGLDQLVEPEGRSPLDVVLASASHPGGFRPSLIDRSDDRGIYAEKGITNFPASGMCWYTDGGLVESEPIGRVIEAARPARPRTDGRRAHLVIDPWSSDPSAIDDWGSDDDSPSWLAGLRRAMSILPSQALQDDQRGVVTTNQRLRRLETIVDALAPILEEHPHVVDRLAERSNVATEGSSVRCRLRDALADVAGLTGKDHVRIELISPMQVASDRSDDVNDLLAGDFIGAFGGFLSRDLRASDFDLGWASARSWLEDGLDRHGVALDDIESVCTHVDDLQYATCEAELEPASSGVDNLGMAARWRLATLGGRIGRILVGEALPTPVAHPVRWLKQRTS